MRGAGSRAPGAHKRQVQVSRRCSTCSCRARAARIRARTHTTALARAHAHRQRERGVLRARGLSGLRCTCLSFSLARSLCPSAARTSSRSRTAALFSFSSSAICLVHASLCSRSSLSTPSSRSPSLLLLSRSRSPLSLSHASLSRSRSSFRPSMSLWSKTGQ